MKFIVLSKEDLLRMLASLIIGTILGATGTNLILSQQYDELLLINQSLKIKIEEDQQRLKQLEKDTNGIPIVSKVVLKLLSKEDKHTEKDLEEKIKKLLTGLVGLKITELDTTILRDIVHDRTVILQNDAYHLAVETIIVDDELTFVVKVEKVEEHSLVEED